MKLKKLLHTSAKGAWLVGDSIRDLEAGREAGCQPFWCAQAKELKWPANLPGLALPMPWCLMIWLSLPILS